MAIIPTTQITVARYAAGLYGVKLGSATNQAVLADVQLNSANGVNGLNTVLNAYYAPFASMTSAQVAAIVVANAGIVAGRYGLTAQNVSDATATVTAALNAAAPLGQQGKAIADVLADWSNTFTNDAVFGAAAKAWNVKIAQATGYSASFGTSDVAFGEINTEFRLDASSNNRTGTEGDDTFIAVQGTFDNADRVNGGAGFDTLKAQVSGVVAPTISDVEHLQFQAQHRGTDSGDNNVSDTDIVKVDFNTNVTNVTGFTTIENSNSRADLIVEDVRIANNQITKDITIIMRETDPGNVDYGVYFDQNSLRNVSSSSSQINLRVLDTYNTSLGNAPLKDSPYGAFTFSYSLNGAAPVSVKLESAAIQNAQTFPEMVAALQAAADAIFGAGAVTVSTGATYTVPDSVTGAQVQGTEIVLAAKGNITFSTPAGSGWTATETVPAISGLHTAYTVGGATSTELVTSNIILDDVGRGSTGGDLVVGGLSVGETSTSKGVQKFLIEVQDNSKLQTINSTNNTLREVVLTSGVTTRVDNAYNDNAKDAGNLTVRGFEQPNDGEGNNALPGIDTLTGADLNHGAYGFTDVRVIDGSAFRGKLDFDAHISERSIAKYLNLTDGAAAQPGTDNANFVYTGGLNNDTIAVRLDAGTTVARNLQTGREDFTFSLNGGAGNDALTLEVNTSGQTANWYANQKTLKNLSIDGGAGNDTIKTPGWGDVKITAGTGDDTVYADNSGTVGAKWVVNQTGFNADPLAGTVPTAFLVGGKVTVSFAPGALAGGGVTGVVGATAADAVSKAYTNGFEVVVDIPTGANYAVTQYHINQAIKAAINGDAVLSKLLVAEDGPASTLNITSKIDGAFAANDLEIVVSSSQGDTVAADVLAAYKTFTKNSAATAADVLATNTATIAIANGVTGVGIDRGVFAQTSGSTLAATVKVTTEGSSGNGPTPATFEQAVFTPVALTAGQKVIINGLTLTAGTAGASTADVVGALTGGAVTLGAITKSGVLSSYNVTASTATTVTFTSAVTGNVADLTNTGNGGGSFTYVQGAPAVAGSPAATEKLTLTLTGVPVAGETVTLTHPATGDAVTYVVLAGDTAAQVATGLAGAVTAAITAGGTDWADYATAAASGATITLTGNTNTPIANLTAASLTTSTPAGANNGSISLAESDNTIDLGAGNDVAVLGTGTNSNDTIVFTGYNLGKNTIVNFDDGVNSTGRDLLDFNAYLTGKSSASGSVDSQRDIDIAYNSDTSVEANSVTVLTSAVFTAENTFAGLTAEKLVAALNSNGTAYAGITSSTLDAVVNYSANALVGGVGKAVVLVQNDANQGEYLAFELAFNATATNTNADFTSAQLIGTVDFGATVAFAQNLLVA